MYQFYRTTSLWRVIVDECDIHGSTVSRAVYFFSFSPLNSLEQLLVRILTNGLPGFGWGRGWRGGDCLKVLTDEHSANRCILIDEKRK